MTARIRISVPRLAAFAIVAALLPAPRDAKADALDVDPGSRGDARPGLLDALTPIPVHALQDANDANGSAASDRAHAQVAALSTPPEYGSWKGLSTGCSYIAPKSGFVANDGGVDVVFHFHAGQMSERQMKESGTNAVFVACGFGMGTSPYASQFAWEGRFGFMMDRLVKNLEAEGHRAGIHLRHVALASWSAGFAAVGKILAVGRWYDRVDAVVLLDSLHARYKGAGPHGPAEGADQVETASMGVWVKLANDAAHGKKALVVTHSSIVPPDYASAAEATAAVLTAIGLPTTKVDEGAAPSELGMQASAARGRPMSLAARTDVGALHVRGYRGRGPKDHFDHLYLIGEALRSWVVPRWMREDRLVYTLAGEQR